MDKIPTGSHWKYVIPENIHTSPVEEVCFETLTYLEILEIGQTVKSLKFSKAYCGPGLILVEFVNVKTVTCK